MANTYTLIEAKTLGSAAASIEFTSIPNTYTDLLVKVSTRDSGTGNTKSILLTFNNSTSGYSNRMSYSDGSSVGSYTSSRGTDIEYLYSTGAGATSSTFSNSEIYIPNYASSNYKSVSIDTTTENNATGVAQAFSAGLWSNTAAITSVKLTSFSDTFVQYSTVYLYGISNS
jgi:hypothetical protein